MLDRDLEPISGPPAAPVPMSGRFVLPVRRENPLRVADIESLIA